MDSDVDISKDDEAVDQELMSIIEKVCKAGVEAGDTLNNLDRECGDGDAGDTLATACNAILGNIQYFSVSDVNLAFRRIAGCLTNAVGGTHCMQSSSFALLPLSSLIPIVIVVKSGNRYPGGKMQFAMKSQE
ncbi:MAG: hypothetical protein ACE5GV_03685 [Candidatus Scalindua sp.]